MLPSEEVQLTATISPANTSFKKLAWSSSDENVATVDENGLVTAHSGGTATITVRQAVGSSTVSGTCVITVKQTNIQPGQLIANEVQVANIDMFIDPSWNFGGWVELFNKTDEALSLDGLYVSDDPANPLKQRLDSRFGIVPAHGFINLWFDHHSRWAPAMVAFKLDPDGGTFLLSKADGTTLIHLDYPPAISRTSYARTTDDGDTWNYTDQPTPEASNATSTFATSQLAAPVVDKKGGLFTGHITVTVNIPTRTTLRYTLDGSTPTLTNGEVSRDGRFDFDATAILRVRLFQNGMLASPVVTRSFIYQDKNYTLPVLSLVSDDANLYGSAYGIFVKGSGNGRAGNGQDDKCNWNMDWDRPANIEFYPEDGTAGFNQETSVESSGGWSRAWTPHSFNIKANKVYEGLNRMEYQFFPNKPFLNHKALKVRNGGNDNGDRIKDAAIQQVVTTSGLYVETQSYRPVHIFHNGKYIGVENLREPNNKHYALANYGIDTDDEDMDQWKMSPDSGYVQQVGDAVAWKELLELSESADEALTYEQIKERIDIEEYCNYLSVMFYVGCTDWPQNNIKAFRSRTEGESNSRFRFVIFDTDHSFNTTTSAFTTFDGKQWYTFDPLRGKEIIAEYGSRIYEEIEFVTLFKNLIQNEEFCKQFVDQFCLVAGSVFEPNRSREIIQAMLDHVNPAMQLEGRSASSSANSVMNNLSSDRQSRMIRALRDYLGLSYDDQLYVSLESNLDEATLRVNGLEVPTGKFGGTLFAPITITASAPAGYRFTGWENDGYLFSSDPTLELDESLDLVATFEPLKGKELAASDAHPVKINEVSATNDIYVSDLFKKSDWIELYNTTDNDYDLAGMYLTDHAHLPQRFQFPASTNKISTVIPAHGHLVVWCDDKEAVGQIHTGFKLENNDTCYVILTAADKSWADTLAYCRHDGFHTVGLYPDGGSELYVMERPTIGATNTLTTHAVAWEEPTIGQTVGINVSDLAVVDDLQLTYANRNLRLHTTAAAARIDVFNAAGNLVQTSRAVNGANVSLTALPAGIYIARASTDDNQTTLKFTLR